MRKSQIIKCVFLCGIFFLSYPAKAEQVREAMLSAWQTNPQLLAARAGFFSISTDVQLAFSEWLPQANLQLEYGINQSFNRLVNPDSQNRTRINGQRNPWSATVVVTQNIFRNGQIIANFEQARSNREAAFGDLTSVEQSVLLAAATFYFDLLRDQAIVRLNSNNLSVLRKRLLETRNRFRVGAGTRTLVAFSEARVAAARTQVASAEAQLVASQAAYQRTIGRAPTGRLRFTRAPNLPKSKVQSEALAQKNHPLLISARQRFHIASTAKVAAYGLFLPSVSVEGVYRQGEELSPQTRDSTNLSITGRLSMPIYRGGASFATVRKAAHEAERARFMLLDQVRQINEMVANAWQRLRTARAQINSASQEVKASRIALEGIRQQQLLGTSTFLDSLDSEQDYLNAQVSLATARRDEQVASYTLLAATGLLTAQQLGLGGSLR